MGSLVLRAASCQDTAFIVEMARHACVIEDWPLPPADSDEVRSLLPSADEVPIIAADSDGVSLGAVWTFHDEPPLLVDATGIPLPELCIGVVPGMRGCGVGGALLDELFRRRTGEVDALCSNVHVRNPAQKLYQRKGFELVGQGRGPLGLAMRKELR